MAGQNRNLNEKNTASVHDVGQTVSASALTLKEELSIAVFGVLLFVAMTVQTGRMSVVLCVLALISAVAGKKSFLRLVGACAVPVIGLLAFAVMQGFAAIYSPFDHVAAQEYCKLLAAFSLGVILLSRFERKHVPSLLWAVTAVGAVISLVSVDLDASGLLFAPFNALTTVLGVSYSELLGQMNGSRITGLYNDANVSACLSGMAALLGLHLMRSQEKPARRLCAALLCGINAMAFFLCMSRGAIAFFAVACVVWLVAAGKGSRISLFLSMCVCGVVTVALSVPAMRTLNGVSVLPTILTVLCGVVIFALDWLLVQRLVGFLSAHVRLAVGSVAAVLTAMAVYLVAAFLVTGPGTITNPSWNVLARSVNLPAGEYTMTGEWDGVDRIYVFWQNDAGKLVYRYDTLYDSGLQEDSAVRFTVPEDGGTVLVEFAGPLGTEISSAAFSDGTKLVLGRPLLPDFVTERLQDGVLRGTSTFQRVEFDRDAWTLFCRSPLVGHGLGATENLTRSVQRFAYESKYSHNHILQVMVESGLLGLAAFLTLLGGSLWMAFRHRKEDTDGIIPVFFAVWTLMNLHSLMEINFSIRAFQCFAYVLLLLPAVLCTELEQSEGRALWVNRVKPVTAVLLIVYLVVFGGLFESHRTVVRKLETFEATSVSSFLFGLEGYIAGDVFAQEPLKLSYVANAVGEDDAHVQQQAQKYVATLRKGGTYTACSGLARYYYLPQAQWEDLFAVSREGLQQVASSSDGWNLQMDFYRSEVLPAMGAENMTIFSEGVLALQAQLDAFNVGRMETVELNETNAAFVEAVRAVQELPETQAYTALALLAS